MRIVGTAGDRASPAGGAAPLVVACLCAAWCDTCRAFERAFERLAAADTAAVFVWIDVEDDADLCGDVDVENFPTLGIFRGPDVLHFGTTLPSEAGVGRLIEAVRERRSAVAAGDEVAELALALRARLAT